MIDINSFMYFFSVIFIISHSIPIYCKSHFLWSSYFCKFREQLNNAKILAHKLVKIIL